MAPQEITPLTHWVFSEGGVGGGWLPRLGLSSGFLARFESFLREKNESNQVDIVNVYFIGTTYLETYL